MFPKTNVSIPLWYFALLQCQFTMQGGPGHLYVLLSLLLGSVTSRHFHADLGKGVYSVDCTHVEDVWNLLWRSGCGMYGMFKRRRIWSDEYWGWSY